MNNTTSPVETRDFSAILFGLLCLGIALLSACTLSTAVVGVLGQSILLR